MAGASRRSAIAKQGERACQALGIKGELGKPVRMPLLSAGAIPARAIHLTARKSGLQEGRVNYLTCKCGQQSNIFHPDNKTAYERHIERNCGWRKIDGQWECATCCGNTKQLLRWLRSTDDTGRVL